MPDAAQSPLSVVKDLPTLVIDHFINGATVPALSGRTFEDINPATAQRLAVVAHGGAEDIDRAVAAAKKAYEEGPWGRMPMAERCRLLRCLGDLILENLERLALAETQDTGKPITESREGDIPRSARNCHFYSEYAPSLGEDCFTVDELERHLAVREPLGVVGLITPWNLPLHLATWKLAPSLAMGNTCVLKPAEWTPYTAFLLGQLVNEAGIPPGVVNIVQGFGPDSAGEALTRHPDVAAISFTGEGNTGKAIMAAAAQTLKKVSFELGGKGATVLFADADLDEAIPTAMRAAYRNQGEVCLAGSRLLVQQSILDTVLARVVSHVEGIRVGNPEDPATQMGALIHAEHLAKVERYLEIGKSEGRLLTGGQRLTALGPGYFLSPAVIANVRPQARVAQEEIFGPVLPVIAFDTEEEAVAIANGTPYGLSASLWSQDVNRCHRVSRQLKSGLVWVNCWFARDLRAPFGGFKASGVGREGGRYSLEFFSEAKTICTRYR